MLKHFESNDTFRGTFLIEYAWNMLIITSIWHMAIEPLIEYAWNMFVTSVRQMRPQVVITQCYVTELPRPPSEPFSSPWILHDFANAESVTHWQ